MEGIIREDVEHGQSSMRIRTPVGDGIISGEVECSMAKGPSTKVARIVLEGPATGDKTVPAYYVRRWWWPFNKWLPWAWTRHSYIINREAKAKAKVIRLYQQLLAGFKEASEAESDVAKAIKQAQEGDRRGISPVLMVSLGDAEELVSYDRDAWKELVPILKQLSAGTLKLSRRGVGNGPRTGYYLSEAGIRSWDQKKEGSSPLDPTLDNKMVFRPPEDKGNQKGGKGGGGKDNQPGKDGIPVLMVRPDNKVDE